MFIHVSEAQLHKPPPQVDWIIEKLVARGALTLLAGEGGLGKSSLALALAAAAAGGLPNYAGFRIRETPGMVYIDAENPLGEIHRRANAFQVYKTFYRFDGDLANALYQVELRKIFTENTGNLIVLDSFRSLWPSVEENDTKSVLPVLRNVQHLAREFNVGALILHHTSKAGVYRGSTEFQNRPDVVTTLKRDTQGHGRRFIDWNKMRIAMEPDRHFMTIKGTNGKMEWEHSHSAFPAGKGPSADWDEWSERP